MELIKNLIKRIKGKPHEPFDIGKRIETYGELQKAEKAEQIRKIEADRERVRARRLEKEKREWEKTRAEIVEAEERTRRPQVRQEFEEMVVNKGNRNAAYLNRYLEDPQAWQALNDLIEAHDGVADIIHELAKSDDSVHGNPQFLLRLSGELLYEAHRAERQGIDNAKEVIEPLMRAIKDQVSRNWLAEGKRQKNIRGEEFNERKWVAGVLGVSEERAREIIENNQLPEQIYSKVNEILAQVDEEQIPESLPGETRPWTEAGREPLGEDVTPPEEFITQVNKLWRKVETEAGKGKLGYRELNNYQDELLELEHDAYPAAVYADTEAYNAAIRKLHDEVEGKLNALGQRAVQLLEREGPPLSVGKVTKEEFLKKMGEPGYFGRGILQSLDNPENKELLDLFVGHSEESQKFRDQVFLKLHTGVLTFKRDSSQDTFGLYQRGDFDSFISFLKNRMPHRIDKKTGNTVAMAVTTHYTNLSNAIRLSRDIDYNASQPGADIQILQRIAALYQNEYVIEAMSIPAVEQAYRCIEDTLTLIKDANDGYIPPGLIEYDAVGRTSYLDDQAQVMLKKIAENLQVYDIKRDEDNSFLHVVEKDGRTIAIDRDRPDKMRDMIREDHEGLQLAMYMTLAKGFHMGTARLLEMIANSKVPGSDHPVDGMPGFHSMAGYEGVASALNYMSLVIEKFKIGGFKYFHLMNMMLPKDQHLPVDSINAREAVEVYLAYRDGTLAEKFPNAKRLLDLTNFSKISSALGSVSIWRYLDATIDWSDKALELLGGPVRIILSKNYAEKKIKEFLVINSFKVLYRGQIEAENRKLRDEGKAEEELLPEVGPRFDALWESQGQRQYQNQINAKLDQLAGKTAKGKVLHHTKEKEAFEEWVKKYRLAYNARIWTETVMRNPIVVAHNVQLDVPTIGFDEERGEKRGKYKKTSLHSLIAQEIFGVPPEDFQYATVLEEKANGELVLRQKAGKYTSPTEEQKRYLNELLDLEGDMASVREVAIREQRDLTLDDFDDAIQGENEEVRRKRAKRYWDLCRQAVLGSADLGRANELYETVGLTFPKDGSFVADYKIDWKKIDNIEDTLDEKFKKEIKFDVPGFVTSKVKDSKHPLVLNQEFLAKDWDWMFGTNDMALRQMDLMNLGSRSWFRRVGIDIPAHMQGSQLIGTYIDQINPQPNDEFLQKTLKDIVNAYAGDDIMRGWEVGGMLSFATDKIYAFDPLRLGSYAQKEIWKEMIGVDAWGPNRRYKWWHGVRQNDIIPPHGHDFYYNLDHQFNVHALERASQTTLRNLILEMILIGMLSATVIMAYRALSAKSEEDEGSGGPPH